MMRVWIVSALVLCGAAAAQAPPLKPMTAKEAKAALIGRDLQGRFLPSNEPFRECIDAKGETRFWFGGEEDRGRLTVRADGAACFSYVSSNFTSQACFSVFAKGRQLRFEQVGDPAAAWETTSAKRVRSCEPTQAPMS